ncbi:hypothetical protein MATL_G00015080 [Megalops atlanticus]|uniref:B30.2/SPRY domain-containing protein n=1 Tax=Megalops atlanticus TaxID=7932 RepID=A0A9D3QHT1_MEGAT|nr:hypothetical protein MATL_G00015080 [Megalops atlanticus]
MSGLEAERTGEETESGCVRDYGVMEALGYVSVQRDEYFRERFGNRGLSERVTAHLESARGLFLMCRIPAVCRITAAVLERLLSDSTAGGGVEMPQTLTEVYCHLLAQAENYSRDLILKMAGLAFVHLEEGVPLFREQELIGRGIAPDDASSFSSVFLEGHGALGERTYVFSHPSLLQYFAAVHVFDEWRRRDMNILEMDECRERKRLIEEHGKGWYMFEYSSDDCSPDEGDGTAVLFDVLKSAVRRVCRAGSGGQLDLFLGFLLGITQQPCQGLLQGILGWEPGPGGLPNLGGVKKIAAHVHRRIRKLYSAPERCIGLVYCLSEMHRNGLVEEVCAAGQSSGAPPAGRLGPVHCSELAYELLTSEQVVDELDLGAYDVDVREWQRLAPVLRNCRSAVMTLRECDADRWCETIASVLRSANSPLRELDLSCSFLADRGLERLCDGLASPHCQLEALRLASCLPEDCGASRLCAALSQPTGTLLTLDLGCNALGDAGVERLCAGLTSPRCSLQRLGLSGCRVTDRGCASLALALRSNPSRLRELDLSYNHVGDMGVRALSAGLEDPACKLQKLLLRECNLTGGCCGDLASVLRSPHSELIELELRDNDLQDSGVKALSAGLEDRSCRLQTLGLSGCCVTESGCAFLASALQSNPSHLRELDLSYNHPGDSGVRALSVGLEDPSCKLEKLLVDHGGPDRNTPGLRKYACRLSLDPNTAHRQLQLSEGNTRAALLHEEQPYPDHLERFEGVHRQALGGEALSRARCYWEVEWSGKVDVGVTYRGIRRKVPEEAPEMTYECGLGWTGGSWIVSCSVEGHAVCHRHRYTATPAPPSSSRVVGVYLDWLAGTLSFYSVSSGMPSLLHTVRTAFTEPLYPGVVLVGYGSLVRFCQA